MLPFIVHALPRSRTKWLSKFLSYNEWTCGHEQAILLRSVYDLKRLFSLDYTGTVETASAQAWRIIRHHAPHVKHAVIRRPVADVMKSMLALDLSEFTYDVPRLQKIMEYGDRMLAELSEQPGVLSLDFADLDTEQGCRRVFEFCLPYRFDTGWWRYFKDKNIQCDAPQYIRYYHDNRPDVEAFKSLLWKEMRRLRRGNLITRH